MVLASDALWFRFNGMTPKDRQAVSEVVEDGAKEAVESVKRKIPAMGIRSRTGKLLNAVKYSMRSMLHARIFIDSREAPYAPYLEEGYGPHDMKEGLLSSPKAKMSRQGFRYIRVPMDNGNKIVTLSESNKSKRGFRSSWRHPGYTGKLFLQHGVEEVMPHIVRRVEERIDELQADNFMGEMFLRAKHFMGNLFRRD